MKLYVVLLFIGSVFFDESVVQTRDVLPQHEIYTPDYQYYHNLTMIYSKIKTFAKRHVNYIKVDWSYLSRDGLTQPILRISDFTQTKPTGSPIIQKLFADKVKILLSFGEHAREFLPVESLLTLLSYVSSELETARSSTPQAVKVDLSKLDIFVVGILNPDGRRHVESTHNYCWRGTGNGVDLNRNFDWNFGGIGSSGNPNDEEYHGSSPFSEPECRVLRELTEVHTFDVFLSLHSGIQQMYTPYADTRSKLMHVKPKNLDGMLNLCRYLSQATKYNYKYGPAHTVTDYTADGTIFDFMAGIRKIPFSIAIELWGNGNSDKESCFDLFNPHSLKLKDATEEILPIYIALFQYMIKWKQNPNLSILQGQTIFHSSNFLCIFLVILTVVCVLYKFVRSPRTAHRNSTGVSLVLKLSSQFFQYFYLICYRIKSTICEEVDCDARK